MTTPAPMSSAWLRQWRDDLAGTVEPQEVPPQVLRELIDAALDLRRLGIEAALHDALEEERAAMPLTPEPSPKPGTTTPLTTPSHQG